MKWDPKQEAMKWDPKQKTMNHKHETIENCISKTE